MSKLKGILIAALLLNTALPAIPGQAEAEQSSGSGKAKSAQKRWLREGTFEVLGAGCAACIRKIEMDLRAQAGVELVKVAMNVQPPVVTVVYDMDKAKLKELCSSIEKQGYGIRNMRDAFHSAEPPSKKKDALFSMPELSAF